MLKLMKLEMKKIKMSGYIKGALLANLIILAFLVLVTFASKSDGDIAFKGYSEMFLITGTFVRGTFSIFAAVLISRLIIGEYTNKTITLMFMYPIKRKHIMLAKLTIVIIFTFISMVISNIFSNFCMYFFNAFAKLFTDTLTVDMVAQNIISIFVYSIGYSFLSLIPIYVGMKRKSTSATIVTSIILTSILNGSFNGSSLSSIIIIPLILGIVGAVISYISIKDVEDADVVN
ncbi:ABC-2 family transporter protein [Clostridium pasteurianum DSM 525 = ATCC 6013]|uniref:ABC-2 family transporter protein n=1 Tax=Clostridium pasteurianum DSM 525 = ATCC 6013 TaxID=1262449 RepID=A0A0H3J7J3_CLOPA|nr:ABC transporter permease [Clostridium pasteurianum]AJA49886.1 ABC-2 family transporter protein [Clostridium pasteurianum DSM 525 = ATCC 6013]AJA53874.1 ABC-2 family transporter protein [Clostridium pasteurianum DSM 525 = ATCC 6013]AOZ77029.1 hypothetical protein AQ983_18720 [Clostridium pasteurianum DSM 525 = ATCC 6013]AOZ80826.1 hypothetical protein AQ984_18715 [Clostridium pasteurianum]ELP57846.1 Na+-driven exporter or maturation protein [Clostridium pasteurianum DSM 525 = ATCC 6013]